jgi:hypothetical protein
MTPSPEVSQILWLVRGDPEGQVQLLDVLSGQSIYSHKFPSPMGTATAPEDLRVTQAGGMTGQWLVLLPPAKNVAYVWHGYHLSGLTGEKSGPSHAGSSHTSSGSPWFKLNISNERWTAFCLSFSQAFFLAGTSSGKVYVWHVRQYLHLSYPFDVLPTH